ncbi:hypothetical protein [Halococcus hamelinensis]|uniref:Uncharacterized protein n=1 Tax=Halococcus hamelinensis 100A6 TaxID=1132509 RepID=M0M0S2_9EURY|nr:hypothetical protein [Halococcus hamelinensis]EMA37975.1 hypothetical protein C447_11080 [Halococcus hamelinensis 100A6]
MRPSQGCIVDHWFRCPTDGGAVDGEQAGTEGEEGDLPRRGEPERDSAPPVVGRSGSGLPLPT